MIMSNSLKANREQVYLAALLHDIGKFYERAQPGKYKGGIFKYSHAEYTAKFFDDFPQVKNKIDKVDLKDAHRDFNLINIAAKHHDPGTLEEIIIQYADWFASSERYNKEQGQDIPFQGKENQPLYSIFNNILGNKPKEPYYVPLKEYSLDEDLFPNNLNNISVNYREHFKSFVKEFTELNDATAEVFAENLLELLKKYTATVPSATNKSTVPDISLYDHSKVTAAFAVAIYNFLEQTGKDLSFIESYENKPFILIGADLSGIQNFIYDIIHTQAAKNLKARSFYIQLVLETVLRIILQKLNLFKANVIYSAGGNFYILAQNTADAIEALAEIEKIVNEYLRKKFHNRLYLAINFIEFGRDEIENNKIKDIWQKLIREKVDAKKYQKFRQDLIDKYEQFFQPLDVSKFKTRNDIYQEKDSRAFAKDAISGTYILKDEKVEVWEDGKGETNKNNTDESNKNHSDEANKNKKYITETNKKIIELSRLLREMDYWIITKERLSVDKSYEYEIIDRDFTLYHYFMPQAIMQEQRKNLSKLHYLEVITLNNWKKFNQAKNTIKNPYGVYSYQFYGGNDYPVYTKEFIEELKKKKKIDDEDNIMEKQIIQFHHLAVGENFHRLGIVRMDVDFLGKIFAKGFEDDKDNVAAKYSFSRLATLSRSLDFFFSGYLNKIWDNKEYKNKVMIIYSGGDDLFLVGRWDKVLDMAAEIREKFQQWTACNPKLSISGGMQMVSGKFPILKAAEDAGQAESKAKNHTVLNTFKKNSFTIFDTPLNWDTEFNIVKELKDEFIEKVSGTAEDKRSKLPQGFLFTIQRFYALCQYQMNKGKNPSWQWLILYYLKRLGERVRPILEIYTEQLMEDILANSHKKNRITSNYKYLELAAIAARWAELELRTEKNKNNENSI